MLRQPCELSFAAFLCVVLRTFVTHETASLMTTHERRQSCVRQLVQLDATEKIALQSVAEQRSCRPSAPELPMMACMQCDRRCAGGCFEGCKSCC